MDARIVFMSLSFPSRLRYFKIYHDYIYNMCIYMNIYVCLHLHIVVCMHVCVFLKEIANGLHC